MNHYLSLKAYVLLNFFLYVGMSTIFNIITGNLYRLDVEFPLIALITMKVGLLFIATYITAGRFLVIEKRPPNSSERNSIALWAFLLIVFGMLLYAPLSLGLYQMRTDLSTNDAIVSLSTTFSVLSVFVLLFLHLNFGAIARMRSAQS